MNDGYIRIIGIDPGLETTGVGIIDAKGNNYRPIFCDCIITKNNLSNSERLKQIYNSLNDLINEFKPQCLAIEELFFSANVKTAISVGAARGVSILAGGNNNIDVYEYTPLQVKQAIVGYGRATKKQIKYMLKVILGKNDDFFPRKDDAWDALGIAVCHASMSKFKKKVSSYLK